MKTAALLASLSLVVMVGCADNEEPATPPPSETSRATEPTPPSSPPPETSQSMEPSTPSTAPSQKQTAQPGETPAETQMAQPEEPPATATANDQELKKRIQEALEVDTALSDAAENIQIDTTAGKVTLRGSVPSEKEKEEIATKVEQMEGVQEVDNQLQVASR